MRAHLGFKSLAFLVAALRLAGSAAAQESSRGYDPLAAGQDAYRLHEARRLAEINNQIGLIEQTAWYSGALALPQDPPSLETIYATGRRSAFGFGAWGRGLTPLFGEGYFRDVFTPWPTVPGDIWGYQTYPEIPQPIGQRQFQTGPHRWESHPVYSGAPPYRHGVGVSPLLAPPASSVPRVEPRRGPREF